MMADVGRLGTVWRSRRAVGVGTVALVAAEEAALEAALAAAAAAGRAT
ncbi:MAG: hypothetical protein JWN44_4025, partial [Myxococcales bacterium]|nr:hypothetical protein [Myxococcales bacterium]